MRFLGGKSVEHAALEKRYSKLEQDAAKMRSEIAALNKQLKTQEAEHNDAIDCLMVDLGKAIDFTRRCIQWMAPLPIDIRHAKGAKAFETRRALMEEAKLAGYLTEEKP